MHARGDMHGSVFWTDRTKANSFGLRMLQSMGWKQGQGLGKRQDGRNSAIVVRKRKIQNSGMVCMCVYVCVCCMVCSHSVSLCVCAYMEVCEGCF